MNSKSPRQRRQARTRHEILAVALEVIEEQGIDKFSLREIARRVDYSPAGLYEYFGSKDEIVQALCTEGDRRLSEAVKSVDTSLPFKTYLIELGLAYVRYARQNPEYFKLMFTAMTVGITSFDEHSRAEIEAEDSAFTVVVRAMQRGIDEGLFQERPGYTAFEMAYTTWALVHGMATLQNSYLVAFQADFPHIDRLSMQALVEGMCARHVE